MKKFSYTATLFALICVLLCACGTDGTEIQAPQEDELEILSTDTIQRPARTAVLLENATLYQCYSGMADESMRLLWVPLAEDTAATLSQGDLVLALDIQEEQVRVYVPTGDTPNALYGTLPTGVLSLEAADLQNAAMANIDGCLGQNTETQEVEQMNGLVRILERDGTRCKVQNYGGGDERTFWVQTSDLSFDLDQVVPDRGDL